MKKNKLLTMLSISTIVLANAGMVLADAPVVPVDPSASTEVTPKPETPAEPSLPVPETPSEPSTEPEKPVEPAPNPSTPSSEDKKDEEKPKPEEKPKTTDEANQAGKSQIGTTSTATGQVVQDVAPNKPVTTNSGVTIVGVQDSNPIIANADGTTSVVSAASIGATVNPDQTVSVTTASGEVKTLPKTGEKALISSLLSLIGLSLLAVGTKLKKLF
ncbi:TPA: peptidase [Streptococcus agalactiae]